MRRALLVGFVSLLGACSPEPAPAPTPAAQIPEVTYGDLSALGPVVELEAPLGATRAALLVTLASPDGELPAIEVRGVDADGAVTDWVPLEIPWREGALLVARADLPRLSHRTQLRLPDGADEAIVQLTWSALVPPPPQEPRAPEGDIGVQRQALRAEIAALGVHPREEWGARASAGCSMNAAKDKIAIHHTVTNPMTEPTAALRSIQSFHMDGQGWCDVGYHFLVSLDGRVWEARPIEYLGAHVGGHNTGNIGVSFIGCFHPSGGCESLPPQMPPDAMVQAGADVVAGLADLYGIPINPTTVKGHRDHAGASTACPGDYLHARLDEIRSAGTTEPPAGYWAGEWVQQTFPLASGDFQVAPLEEVSGFFELRNTGNEPWMPGVTFLSVTQPRGGPSPLAGPDWVSTARVATVDQMTMPDGIGRFFFTIKAPREPGTYPQFFNLENDGIFFSDPGQGGPVDDQLEVRPTVLDITPWGDDAGARPDGGVAETDAGPGEDMEEGCSCRAAGRPSGGASGWALLGLALTLLARRRT